LKLEVKLLIVTKVITNNIANTAVYILRYMKLHVSGLKTTSSDKA